MIKETLRIVTKALQSDVYGVNVMLEHIPLDDTEHPPPEVKRILEETVSDEAARLERPRDWPVLMVTTEAPTLLDPSSKATAPYREDGRVWTAIRYASGESDDAERRRQLYDTLRAAMYSLRSLILKHSGDAVQNNVQLVSVQTLFFGGTEKTELDEVGPLIAGALLVEWFVRDELPAAIP